MYGVIDVESIGLFPGRHDRVIEVGVTEKAFACLLGELSAQRRGDRDHKSRLGNGGKRK